MLWDPFRVVVAGSFTSELKSLGSLEAVGAVLSSTTIAMALAT